MERANQTLQDRLVKEIRLRGIATLEEANAFAPTFIESWNARSWIHPPRDAGNAHCLWMHGAAALEESLARIEERTLSKNLMFQHRGTLYAVQTDGPGTALRVAKVTLLHRLDGPMEVRYRGRTLTGTPFKQRYAPLDPLEDAKTLDARMTAVLARGPGVSGVDNARVATALGGRAPLALPTPASSKRGHFYFALTGNTAGPSASVVFKNR